MMFRTGAALIVFFLLFFLETSLIGFLPEPLRFFPLLLACSVYAIQHVGTPVGFWWLVGEGFAFDFWKIGTVPYETLIGFCTGFVGIIVARHLFSNRSLYGVLGCATICYGVQQALHACFLWILSWRNDLFVSWSAYISFTIWQGILLVILLSICFFFARRIRFFFRHLSLVSTREDF
ncbi:MAG: hypothetical protein UU48_C0019G0006 [Candidatus Uhrbacteria bacterium GW2011_GWF2_41_16]|jgi:hypothetical protein|uniref:Rod shape-determining protein MreD n=2 Tax=Candidatus Uhriibacteriota TaxID=1752732 RepID=A0A0G0V7W1_9BACT|nr:MAG: hypothetical protein UU31_C0006G0006 [Candidatus Uhrbacteria bacterium GW2011_GWA2_41_10]KKR86049.1 MAG: hypothetical protein UU35_C0021G0006 [Candidatus Uhrbacteria bacterium GW2011_GWC2_41_11]KKR97103.1 MAG: hypothetical protein UU48_C0019G0006 [Candidatus Uhrbacteria bacterium GW2011_GWF2_41_16]HBP00314.1 hypothetical protein [Candidatus Uhrbacteria bacterium]